MASRAGWIALGAAVVTAALAWGAWGVGRRHAPPSAVPAPDPTRWPGPRAELTVVPPTFPPGFGVARVALDPGHGAPGNRGNSSCFCVDEQDTTITVAEELRARLEATGRFEVRLTRERGALVEYPDRVLDAEALGAEAFVSLHSDVRGHIERWAPEPGRSCAVATDAPGFAVLFSDEGAAPLVGRRRALGRALARRLEGAGFLPYGGADYAGLYEADDARGLFVDRHAPDQRIFVLRRTGIPAVLVETHNALDPREAQRWEAKETLDAFAAAVAAALAEALAGRGG